VRGVGYSLHAELTMDRLFFRFQLKLLFSIVCAALIGTAFIVPEHEPAVRAQYKGEPVYPTFGGG